MTLLNARRLFVYPRIFALVFLAVWAYWVVTGTGLTDRTGKPVGSDFLVFFAASSAALRGEPAAAYDFAWFQELERDIVKADYPNPWVYPPTYLLVVLPLALLPYLASLATWTATTLTLFLVTLRRIAPHPSTIWLALGFSGTFQNFSHGQNGFLIAALLGGGLLALARWPLVAGALFGLAAIKPHLAAPVLVALIAGRHWKAIGAAFLAAGLMILASAWTFGWSTWDAFLGGARVPLVILENERALWGKMITAYSGARLLGLDFRGALIVQGAVSFAAAGALWWVWSRRTAFPVRASSLCLSVLLFPPYAFSYDLAILALPLAWLGWQSHLENWPDREKVALVVGWVFPVLSPILGIRAGVPVAPLVLLWLLAVSCRHASIAPRPNEPGFTRAFLR